MFEGTQAQARAQLPPRLLLTAQADPAQLPGVVHAVAVGVAREGWQEWDVTLAPGREPADLLRYCTANGFVLRSFDFNRPSLHDVFLHMVGGAAVDRILLVARRDFLRDHLELAPSKITLLIVPLMLGLTIIGHLLYAPAPDRRLYRGRYGRQHRPR